MSISEGLMIDRYRIEGSVGEGGMAIVYRARHRELGSVHAIKQVKVLSEIVKQRLIQEGRLQSSFTHPNVLSVTDLVTIEDTPALVMEYVDGPALSAFLFEVRPTIEQADYLCRRIIKGVAAAHNHGLIHRDLKPGNILLAVTDDAIIPKIADFGLAKALENPSPGQPLTQEGSAMGTPAYMAPEQIQDASMVDARADIFSLGAILYEIVTGQLCFGHGSIMEVWDRVCSGEFTPVAALGLDIPTRMVRAIDGALKVDRDERVADINQLYQLWCSDESAEHIPVTGEGYPNFWPEDVLHKAKMLAPEISPIAGVPGSNISSGASITSAPSEQPEQRVSPHAETNASQLEATEADERKSQDENVYAMNHNSSSSMVSYIATAALVVLLLVVYWGADKFQMKPNPDQSPSAQKLAPKPGPTGGFALMPTASIEDKALFQRAIKNLREGKPSLAHRQFRKLQTSRPTSAIINLGLSVTYFFKGQTGRSEAHATRAHHLSQSKSSEHETIIHLAAATLSGLSKTNLNQWQQLRDRNTDSFFELLYLIACREVLGMELVIKQAEKAQKSFPSEPIFSILELRLLSSGISPAKLAARAETLRTSFPRNNDILLILANALYKTAQYDKAEVHLKNILLTEPKFLAARQQLARIAIAKNEVAMRTQQLLMAMADDIPIGDQLEYLRHHGLHLYENGQLSEALKVWDFCIRQGNQAKETHLALECHRLGTRAILRFSAFEKLQTWITKAEEIASGSPDKNNATDLFGLTQLWAKTTLAVQNNDPNLTRVLIDRMRDTSTNENNLAAKKRLVALSEILAASLDRGETNRKDIISRTTQFNSQTSCAEIYEKSIAAKEFLERPEYKTRLVAIVSKNCRATEEINAIEALSQAELARLFVDDNQPDKASTSVQAFDKIWPHAEDSLEAVRNVRKTEALLKQ
ncbi:MAG: protein kinase [Myxococcota bacterium]|nr:protein kinase [Myxococcota bacterium]